MNSILPGDGIAITLDKPRTLRFDFRALVALNKATGQNPFDGKFWIGLDPAKMQAMLWAGLTHEDKALTLEATADLIDVTRLSEIAELLAEAMTAAMPAKKTAEPDPVAA